MALDQTALLDVLDALKGADVEDRIKQAATAIYQALIEAELSSVIGVASGSLRSLSVVYFISSAS